MCSPFNSGSFPFTEHIPNCRSVPVSIVEIQIGLDLRLRRRGSGPREEISLS